MQRYPFLSVCAVFSCVQTVNGMGARVWNVLFFKFVVVAVVVAVVVVVVDSCDCERGMCRHCKRVCP